MSEGGTKLPENDPWLTWLPGAAELFSARFDGQIYQTGRNGSGSDYYIRAITRYFWFSSPSKH
jgi:hypothetical protein